MYIEETQLWEAFCSAPPLSALWDTSAKQKDQHWIDRWGAQKMFWFHGTGCTGRFKQKWKVKKNVWSNQCVCMSWFSLSSFLSCKAHKVLRQNSSSCTVEQRCKLERMVMFYCECFYIRDEVTQSVNMEVKRINEAVAPWATTQNRVQFLWVGLSRRRAQNNCCSVSGDDKK